MNNSGVLACRALRKFYTSGGKQVVLDGVDLAVGAAEIVAVVGASGSGKTTLLNLMGGLDAPDSGVVELNGVNFADLSDARTADWRNRHLAFIFQFHLLLPEFSALENVAMPLLLRRTNRDKALSVAADCLRSVNLSEHENKTPEKLSGGERQRVAVARALAGGPRCILADEPTGNLDRKNADAVFETMLAASRERQASLVLVSHDEKLAARAGRVYHLADGKLVLQQ